MRFLIALGILALCAPAFAAGEAPPQTDFANVSLTIDEWCVVWNDGDYSVNANGLPGTYEASQTWDWAANFIHDVDASFSSLNLPTGVTITFDNDLTTKNLADNAPAGPYPDNALGIKVTTSWNSPAQVAAYDIADVVVTLTVGG